MALGLYVSSLPAGITWANSSADSGELATAVYTLGVAHPPGYPTYILTGKLFSFLPFGELAYRTNLMSAFFGAAAVGLWFLTVMDVISLTAREPGKGRGVMAVASAVLAALSLATTPLFWSQATITEVYTLNAFFVAAIAFLLVRRIVKQTGPPARTLGDKHLLAAAFLLGLGLGNHATLAFLAPPALLLIAARWSRKSFATVPPALVSVLFGLLIYVYLPISAAQDPPVNWGQANEASGFWWTVSGTPYRQFAFAASSELWIDRLKEWWDLLIDQYYYLGVPLGLTGLWYLWRRRLLIGVFTLSYVLIIVIYAGTYDTADSFVYLIPGFMIFALWLGLGSFWALTEAIPRIWQKLRGASYPRAFLATVTLALILIVALVPVRSVIANYSDQDLSNDSEAIEYAGQVLRSIEPEALLLLERDDHTFSLWYAQFVTDARPGVFLVTQNLLVYDWYVDSLEEQYPGLLPRDPGEQFDEILRGLIRSNLGKRPVYLSDHTRSNHFLFEQMTIDPVTIGPGNGLTLFKVRLPINQ
ncbi:MAG: DUF2723 domain-containing protein [Chloroflexi bacterium]|nr:DUF2723 domain-containing protein [Chloroflexota bacterium]